MNRLGLSIEEAAAIASHTRSEVPHHAVDEPPRLRRPARASTQRSADPSVPGNPLAVSRHRQFAGQLSGIFLDASTYCDLVRPGIALYGGTRRRASQSDAAGDRLEDARLQVRDVAKGATVGYGATWTAKRDSRIAVIAAGYADGIARAAAITEGAAPRELWWPASAAVSSGASPWICCARTSPTCR